MFEISNIARLTTREWRRACLPCTCVQTKITCVQTKMKNFHQISYVFDQNWRFFFKSAIFSLWVYRREFNPASFPGQRSKINQIWPHKSHFGLAYWFHSSDLDKIWHGHTYWLHKQVCERIFDLEPPWFIILLQRTLAFGMKSVKSKVQRAILRNSDMIAP